MSRMEVSRPSLGMLGIEPVRAALEYARYHLASKAGFERGDGHAVVLFPGLGGGEGFMTPLMETCESLGYACFHWGRGRNVGPTGVIRNWLADLASEIEEMTSEHDRVTLLGWSLGGLYAREIARALPTKVRQVITMGTPSSNITDSTHVGWLYDKIGKAPVTIDKKLSK